MSGRIHFLNSLAPVQVPAPLIKGVQVVQVSANGKARPSTMKVSADKFTVTIAPVEQQSSGLFFRSSSSTGDKRGIDIGEVSTVVVGYNEAQEPSNTKKHVSYNFSLACLTLLTGTYIAN